MKPPQKNLHFNWGGCKICHVGNKKNLLYVNGYTYVRMLIVNNKWKKPLDIFCGLMSKFWIIVIYKWVHTCNDLDNGQIHTLIGAKCVILITKTTCYVWLSTHI
jgi:hypothetical protein